MIKKELNRILSLDYKYVGEIKEISEDKYVIRMFNNKDIEEVKSFKDALRIVRIKTAALQEISPIPCSISVSRLTKRKTYILYPSAEENPSIELPTYHFIRTNAAVTKATPLRLSKHINPNNISFNGLARVILFEKRRRFIWNIIISSLTTIGMLTLLLSLIIFPFVSKDLDTTAKLTDHPIFTPESLISSIFTVFFGLSLSFLSIVPHMSFTRNLYSKNDGGSFENKSWWKQYHFKLRVNLLSKLAMLGLIISGFLAAYFSSDTIYMNAYFSTGTIIFAQRVIFYIVSVLIVLIIFTIQISLASNSFKRKQYLKSYVEPDNRPLFDAWGKSPRVKDISFEFDYASYTFKPTNEVISVIDDVFAKKSKLSKAERQERTDWLEVNYKKALNQYLTKKRKLNRKSRI